MLADRVGLTGGLSRTLARVGFLPVHDRGRVLVDVATALGCGATDIVDVEALRVQEQLFGPVASDTTAGRALGEVGQAGRPRIADARAKVREHVWALLDGLPALKIAGAYSMGDQVVLPVDASIVECHSRKELAAGTYKKYLNPLPENVIASVLAHHQRAATDPPSSNAAGYSAESLRVLFGTDT
jgi:hypothetical protein